MIQKELIASLVENKINDTRYFLVDVSVSKDNVITIEVDADEGVDIDFCVELSRFVESNLDRETEDFELNVGSAGLTSPFKVLRQYQKNIGNQVEVLAFDGRKHKGELVSVDDDSFSIDETLMLRKEGDKRKKAYTETISFRYSEVKQTKLIF
ncbi:MAG: ribosome assembly cofactor RimP [Paludibacteraceae bacterium]|nr:ribosome assembly cofactor RimP [Paludibacteraceae bacterium]